MLSTVFSGIFSQNFVLINISGIIKHECHKNKVCFWQWVIDLRKGVKIHVNVKINASQVAVLH